jgi:hypothetical protein
MKGIYTFKKWGIQTKKRPDESGDTGLGEECVKSAAALRGGV